MLMQRAAELGSWLTMYDSCEKWIERHILCTRQAASQ
jgi:hypothetical protein